MAGTRRYARRWVALPLICAAVAVAGVAATAATARTDARRLLRRTTRPTSPLATGVADPIFGIGGSDRTTAFTLARNAGATYARLIVSWKSIAPKTLPASGFQRSDPNSSYYRWGPLDASISAANAAGITPILDIVKPPSWAYRVQPAGWTGGSPKLGELHAFAIAIARHYDGSGSGPVAHVFSVWNEANYTKNLYPQSPTYYRSMVNAVANGVHGVDPADLVAAGELAPVKTLKKDRNNAIPPLAFMRTMLCISNTKPYHRTCSAPAKFDVWTHHPYSNSGPYGHSKSKDGVELGDLPKMNQLLQTAEQLGAIQSAQPVQFWVTEVGWSTNPPNKNGVPMTLEARWVAESMYQMWRSGVTLGTWFQLEDKLSRTPYESGLYFHAANLARARAKPLLRPFMFPFVAYLKPHGRVLVWGRDPTSTSKRVQIQMKKTTGAWQAVAVIKANDYGIFQAMLPLGAKSAYSMRAFVRGSGVSRVFSLTVPHNENLSVIPFPRG